MTHSKYNTDNSKFKHLDAIKRGRLQQMLYEKKYTQKQMALMLGVSQSTISREIRRGLVPQRKSNGQVVIQYIAQTSQIRYLQKRSACRIPTDLSRYDSSFFELLVDGIKKPISDRITSVDCVVHTFRRENPLLRCPCTKTVYTMIEQGRIPGLKNLDLPMKVRLRPRKKKSSLPKGRDVSSFGRSISERDPAILLRSRFGDWEFDVVEGRKGKSSVLTMVERYSRFLITAKVSKNAQCVLQAAQKAIDEYQRFGIAFHTITTDNGREFTSLPKLENEQTKVYYAHAYASWEKGTNERTNRMLREHFPKGTDFDMISDERLQHATNVINAKCRRSLGYQSAKEVVINLLKSQSLMQERAS